MSDLRQGLVQLWPGLLRWLKVFQSSRHLAVVLPAFFLLGSCGTPAPERAVAIGEAWAGPATLALHGEVDLKSAVTGNARHGEHLEIIGQRRRWYKVRTGRGAEGWVDDRQLMDGNQMKRLEGLAKETSGRPSQGVATTFDSLNVHSEPNRLSASFVQVKEGEKFDVISHRVQAKGPLPRRQLLPRKAKALPAARKPKKEPSVPPPPPPQPPPLPQDWVALSKQVARVAEEDLPPVARDDWTLIRTQSGQSGWVLTSRVYMSIPDEVAQYAEGHRITSYFSLGKTTTNDGEKDIWLWTTSESLGRDYDFDGYRVFGWNLRRHRYETSFIQRRVTGFFPVQVSPEKFSVCLEKVDDTMTRKRYGLVGNSIRPMGEEGCERPASVLDHTSEAKIETRQAAPPAKSLLDQIKERWKKLTAK